MKYKLNNYNHVSVLTDNVMTMSALYKLFQHFNVNVSLSDVEKVFNDRIVYYTYQFEENSEPIYFVVPDISSPTGFCLGLADGLFRYFIYRLTILEDKK